MTLYLILFSILSLLAFIDLFILKHADSVKIFLFFSCILFLFSFIRWETGTDWDPYYQFFEYCNLIGESEFEWGFTLLNQGVKFLLNSYTFLLFICAIFLFAFQSAAISRLSWFPLISLLFMWSSEFAGVFFVRQSIATAILLYSVIAIRDKRFIRFLLLVGLAMLFHRTSVIFLPAYWFYHRSFTTGQLLFGILISCVCSYFTALIFNSIGGMVGGVVKSKIDAYMDMQGENFGTQISATQIIVKGFISKIFLFLVFVFFITGSYKRECRGYLNLYALGIMLYFATAAVSTAFARLSIPYNSMQFVLFPFVFCSLANRQTKLLFFVLFLFYCGLRFYTSLFTNYPELYMPYKTIFS